MAIATVLPLEAFALERADFAVDFIADLIGWPLAATAAEEFVCSPKETEEDEDDEDEDEGVCPAAEATEGHLRR